MALNPSAKVFFVNPYNFVSQTTEVEREVPVDGNLTGVIHCSLAVRDRLALPDRNATDNTIRNCFEFFRVDGKPVIPGSEIRGCIRSTFEAVTKSCFSVLNTNVLSQRIPKPKEAQDKGIVPGILRYSDTYGWQIFEARKYSLAKKPKGMQETLVRKWWTFGGDKDAKMSTLYFYIQGDLPVYTCSEDDVDAFEELLEIYLKNANGKSDDKVNKKKLVDNLKKDFLAKKDLPVYYAMSGNDTLTYFSPAQVSRRMFQNTVKSLLGDHANTNCGRKADEDSPAKYCPACRLFGTLGNGNPVASKLRFTDGKAGESVRISEGYDLFDPLLSPKITSVEFYSEKGDKFRDVETWDYDTAGVKLKGRKFYFHSEPRFSQVNESNRPDSITFASKSALDGSTFTFDLFFDKISEDELKKLLWVLTLGENQADSTHMHKLGAAKPYGFGSVKICVKGIDLRSFKDGLYTITPKAYDDYAPQSDIFGEAKAVEDMLRITDIHYLDDKMVSYPIADSDKRDENNKKTDNATSPHQWFAANRTGTEFRYVLPRTSMQEDLELPAMYADSILCQEGVCHTPGCNGKVGKRPDGSYYLFCSKCSQAQQNKGSQNPNDGARDASSGYKKPYNGADKANEEKVKAVCSSCKKTVYVKKSIYEQYGPRYKCLECVKKR